MKRAGKINSWVQAKKWIAFAGAFAGAFLLAWVLLTQGAALFRVFETKQFHAFAIFLSTVWGTVFSLLVVFLLKKLGDYKKQMQTELNETRGYILEAQLQKRQEQLRALQSQINPHFLYNSLDAIRGMAIENEDMKVSKAVGTLSSMFKYTMDFQNSLVSVSCEVAQVERYLNMQNFRFADRFQLEKFYNCDLGDLNKVMLPKFTLQPLVENAVVHGLRDMRMGGKIELRFAKTQKDFTIIVSDNGKGIEEDTIVLMNRILSG